MKKKAFTLVELIVVITILAILGTISFISLSNYSKEARDSKRITDTSSLLSKINIEEVRGTNLSDLIIGTKKVTLQILGKENNDVKTFGKADFEVLKEDGKNFKDPRDKSRNYPAAYAIGGEGKDAYKFIQLATISEKDNKTIIKGNYYTSEDGDAKSLFLTGATSQTESGALIYENNKLPLIYDVGDGVGKDNGGDEGEKEQVGGLVLIPNSSSITHDTNLYNLSNDDLAGIFAPGAEYHNGWSDELCKVGDEVEIVIVNKDNFAEILDGKTLENNKIYKLANGTYSLSDTIVLNNCTAIIGQSKAGTIIERKSGTSFVNMIMGDSKQDLVISTLSLDGKEETNFEAETQAGIMIYDVLGNLSLNNLDIKNIKNKSTNATSGTQAVISGVDIRAGANHTRQINANNLNINNISSDVIGSNLTSHTHGFHIHYNTGIGTGNINLTNIKIDNTVANNSINSSYAYGLIVNSADELSNNGFKGNLDIHNIFVNNTKSIAQKHYIGAGINITVFGNIKADNLKSKNNSGTVVEGINFISQDGNINANNLLSHDNSGRFDLVNSSTVGIRLITNNGNIKVDKLVSYNNTNTSESNNGTLTGETYGIFSKGNNSELTNILSFNNRTIFLNSLASSNYGVRIDAKKNLYINNLYSFNNYLKGNSNNPANYLRGLYTSGEYMSLNNIISHNNYIENNGDVDILGIVLWNSNAGFKGNMVLNNIQAYNNYGKSLNGLAYNRGIEVSKNYGELISNNIHSYQNTSNGNNTPYFYGIELLDASRYTQYGNNKTFANNFVKNGVINKGSDFNISISNKVNGTSSTVGWTNGNTDPDTTGAMSCDWHSAPGGKDLYGINCENSGYVELQAPITKFEYGKNILKQIQPVRFKEGTTEIENYGSFDANKHIGEFDFNF